MNNHKKSVILTLLLLLVTVTASLIAGTYAKYVGDVAGYGGISVAHWNFEGDNETSIQGFTIDLPTTIDETTLVKDRIAPGTSGRFNIELSNSGSDVGVDFKIQLDSYYSGSIPTNVHLYKDANHSHVLDGDGITGQLVAHEANTLTVPIYWQWEYEDSTESSYDTNDTIDGTTDGNSMSIRVIVTGVQTPPGNEITTHIDPPTNP